MWNPCHGISGQSSDLKGRVVALVPWKDSGEMQSNIVKSLSTIFADFIRGVSQFYNIYKIEVLLLIHILFV